MNLSVNTYFQKKCDLPNKSKLLHIVQLHMDLPCILELRTVDQDTISKVNFSPKGHKKALNCTLINILKIFGGGTKQDVLLFATLCYKHHIFVCILSST